MQYTKQVQAVRYFFFSQSLADGIRITLSILLPALLFRHFGYFELGLAISQGALCISIADLPGPVVHKRNGMLLSSGFIFIVSAITGFLNTSAWLTGAEVVLLCFFFSMFQVYGIRAAAIGSAALLVMFLTMTRPVAREDVLLHSALVFSGALWAMALSLLLSIVRPYRMAQRALGECIHETAEYLATKAKFYNTRTDLEKDYRELMQHQIDVNEKQNAVRELLFRTRQIVRDSSGTGRALLLIFVDIVDMFEQIGASYYDYSSIREKYRGKPVLDKIGHVAEHLAHDLDRIGFAVQSNLRIDAVEWKTRMNEAAALIAALEAEEADDVLKKIMKNIRSIHERICRLPSYLAEAAPGDPGEYERSPFVTHQDYDINVLKSNLSFGSAAFRHSLRVSIAALAGFIIAHLLSLGEHSYWILITIVFLIKPAFSLTRQRNIQRLAGTVAGAIIGAIVLTIFKDPRIDFIFLVLFMIGAYTFIRLNYIVMVIFITPYVLILFKLLGAGYMDVIEERLIDTGIGCAVALAASFLLFPDWESAQIGNLLQEVLKANSNYLQNVVDTARGKNVAPLTYKLARKDVYVSTANLSAAFQRMLSEPRTQQRSSGHIYTFVVLNLMLSSNIASLASSTANGEICFSEDELKELQESQGLLQSCAVQLLQDSSEEIPVQQDITHVNEQLKFVAKLCRDICRETSQILKA